jgi:hypothetical protein
LLDSEIATLNIQSPPNIGRLPGFTGAIGQFQIDSVKLSRPSAQVGDPVTLTVNLKGNGNFMSFTPPLFSGVSQWRVFKANFDTEPVTLDVNVTTRSFSFVMIPLSEKITHTPIIPFSYFDPDRNGYVDLSVPPQSIQVVPPTDASTANINMDLASSSGSSGHDAEPIFVGILDNMGSSVRPIKPLQQDGLFLLGIFGPLCLFGILFGYYRFDQWRAMHPEAIQKFRSLRQAKNHLNQYRQALAQGDVDQMVASGVLFFQHLSSYPLKATAQSVTYLDVLPLLDRANLSADHRHAIQDLFQISDSSQFASSPDGKEKAKQLGSAIDQAAGQLLDFLRKDNSN